MSALVRAKTSDGVVDHLLGLLFVGELRGGDRIDLDVVAADLGVSRAPVREALILLERDGLVVMPPYRGAYVADFDAAMLREAFDLYALLCALTSQRAAAAADPEFSARLEAVYAEVDAARTVLEFERAAREFRRVINTAASGPHLRVLFRTFGGLVPAAARLSIERDIDAERAAIKDERDSLQSGDPQAAGAAAVAHIARTASAAVAALVDRGVFASDVGPGAARIPVGETLAVVEAAGAAR